MFSDVTSKLYVCYGIFLLFSQRTRCPKRTDSFQKIYKGKMVNVKQFLQRIHVTGHKDFPARIPGCN